MTHWYTLINCFNCINHHLFKSDWSKMVLIQVSHPHIILFLFIVGFLCFGVYFIREVPSIHTLPSLFLAPRNPPWDTCKMISLWISRTYIWSRCFCFFNMPPLTLTEMNYDTFGDGITGGWSSIQSWNLLTRFTEK